MAVCSFLGHRHIYGHDVQAADATEIPNDVREKLLRLKKMILWSFCSIYGNPQSHFMLCVCWPL